MDFNEDRVHFTLCFCWTVGKANFLVSMHKFILHLTCSIIINYIKKNSIFFFFFACITYKISNKINSFFPAKRKFSKLKFIKSYIRSIIFTRKLIGLAIIIYKYVLIKLENNNLISKSASKQEEQFLNTHIYRVK